MLDLESHLIHILVVVDKMVPGRIAVDTDAIGIIVLVKYAVDKVVVHKITSGVSPLKSSSSNHTRIVFLRKV